LIPRTSLPLPIQVGKDEKKRERSDREWKGGDEEKKRILVLLEGSSMVVIFEEVKRR